MPLIPGTDNVLRQFIYRTFCLQSEEQIATWLRWLLVLIALLFATPLAIASQLTPADDGYGTHQQLGLAPCSFVDSFGIPCPSCGMTTSFAHFVRGQWRNAVQANLAGTILAMIAAISVLWCIAASATGRWWIIQPHDWFFISCVIAIFLLIIGNWFSILFF